MKKVFLMMILGCHFVGAEGPFDKIMGFVGLGGGGWLENLTIRSDQDMNFQKSESDPMDAGPNASMLDIVFVYDDKVVDKLQKMTGEQYFQSKDQIIRDHKDTIQIFSYEVLPNMWKDNIKIEPRDHNVVAILAFARYFTPGDHRTKIHKEITSAEIHMKRNDFEIIDRSKKDEEQEQQK